MPRQPLYPKLRALLDDDVSIDWISCLEPELQPVVRTYLYQKPSFSGTGRQLGLTREKVGHLLYRIYHIIERMQQVQQAARLGIETNIGYRQCETIALSFSPDGPLYTWRRITTNDLAGLLTRINRYLKKREAAA